MRQIRFRSELQREISSGLSVIESWEGVDAFILFGKGGKTATSRADQEIGRLFLHLVQTLALH